MSNLQNFETPINLLNEQAFAANQRGQITSEQKKQFLSVSWARVVGVVLLIVMMGGCLGLGASAFIAQERVTLLTKILLAVVFVFLFLVSSFFMGYGPVRHLRRRAIIQRDYENGAIRQGQGKLVYGEKGYSFDLDNGMTTLPLLANQSNGLVPGTIYQVYYFEESRYLLSAKMARPANPAEVARELNFVLAWVNHFSSEDLLANRQGQVTAGQRAKVIPQLFGGIFLVGLVALFLILFGRIFTTAPMLATLCLTVIFVALLGAGIFLIFRALYEMTSPTLKSMDGPGFKGQRVVHTGESSHVEYYYTIQGQRFGVNHQAYTALVDGLNYRVYYLAYSKKMLSLEVFNNANSSF